MANCKIFYKSGPRWTGIVRQRRLSGATAALGSKCEQCYAVAEHGLVSYLVEF